MIKKIIVLLVVLVFGCKEKPKYTQEEFIQFCTTAKGEVLHTINNLIPRWLSDSLEGNCDAIYESYIKNRVKVKIISNGERKITNVEVFKFFNSYKVDLSGENITDITPLAEMENLAFLNLYNNKVKDISAIAKMKKLKYLDLSDNKIKDISAIVEAKKLKYLNLSDNKINDISAIAKIENLMVLNLSKNSISDISPLKYINIQDLNIDGTDIKNLKNISQMKSLEILAIPNIDDLTELKHLTNLKSLTIMNTQLNYLKGLDELKDLDKLEKLYISYPKLKDISNLKYLKKLKSLRIISGVHLEDITPLSKLVGLKALLLFDINLSDISPIGKLKHLQYLELYSTKMIDISVFAGKKDFYPRVPESMLKNCSPKNHEDIINNVSCYNKDSSKKRHTKKNDFIEYCANTNGGILHTIEQLTMNIDSLKESCDFIYKKYVIGSDDIILSNKKITNLDVFKFFSSRNLILNNNDIKDITPLGKMESLGNLVLDNNPVSDISPLKNKNSNLHRLSIINTKIVDLKSLSNPKSLKKIWISNIKSLKSIKAFINLKELSIVNSELIDLTEIKEFKNLKKLIVKNAPLVDLSPISSLTKLDHIELTDVSVSDISPVKGLKYLKLLLKNTKIDDLSSLSGKIIFLNTYGNKLKWCSPKNRKDFREKVSCYNKDGSEKVKPKK